MAGTMGMTGTRPDNNSNSEDKQQTVGSECDRNKNHKDSGTDGIDGENSKVREDQHRNNMGVR